MLVSFRQTYGNERSKLYEIFSRDSKTIELLNLCDVNIHSFHNCSKETIEKYKSLNKVEKSKYLEFSNITYSETIRELKKELKKLGCTHFLFTQDDTFSAYDDLIDWKELVEYVREFKSRFMLNLYYIPDNIEYDLKADDIRRTFKVFHFNTSDFARKTWYGMDDQAYICTIDMLDEIYDSIYLRRGHICACEKWLKEKYAKKIIPRSVLEKCTLQNYNLFGRTVGKKDTTIAELKRKNLYAG